MRQRRIGVVVKPPIGIISNCDVCGGLMFNAQRYMHMNDAYFTPLTIRFLYELEKMFDRILHELQCLDKVHQHHFTLDLASWIGYSSIALFRAVATPFDTLGFLWLHHGSLPYLLYLYKRL